MLNCTHLPRQERVSKNSWLQLWSEAKRSQPFLIRLKFLLELIYYSIENALLTFEPNAIALIPAGTWVKRGNIAQKNNNPAIMKTIPVPTLPASL